MENFDVASIIVPVAGVITTVVTEAIFYYLTNEDATWGINFRSRTARKTTVHALEIISAMCKHNEKVNLQPYEMAFFLKGFQIPLRQEDDFINSLKEDQMRKKQNLSSIDIKVNMGLKRFHNYIDSAIYALTEKKSIFVQNNTQNMFAANPNLRNLYYQKCSQNNHLSNVGKSQSAAAKDKTVANHIQLFSVQIIALQKQAELTGSFPFISVIDLLMAIVDIHKDFQTGMYPHITAYIHSKERCFSFITSTIYKTIYDYHASSLFPSAIQSLKMHKDQYMAGICVENEFYPPEKVWYLL